MVALRNQAGAYKRQAGQIVYGDENQREKARRQGVGIDDRRQKRRTQDGCATAAVGCLDVAGVARTICAMFAAGTRCGSLAG